MISNASKWILHIGKTAFGRHHDYSLLKKEFDPSEQWFEGKSVLVDLGYLGFEKDYSVANVFIPIKRKAHDKLPAGADLLELKKCFNKRISQMRIAVEHAIGGMKVYRIITQTIRLKSISFVDQITETCAALWNYKLTQPPLKPITI